jgi:hypothetical protein
MAYIDIKSDKPGILGLFEYDPKSAGVLRQLAEVVLRHSTLKQGITELIAAYVSWNNKCEFCLLSHLEAFKRSYAKANKGDTLATKRANELATHLLTGNLINEAEPWLRSLLMLSDQIRLNIKPTQECIDYCKLNGCHDLEIHDTVLVTAAMCMYNRYVSGLDTKLAQPAEYAAMGERMVAGYF